MNASAINNSSLRSVSKRASVVTEEFDIPGFLGPIKVRLYRPLGEFSALPAVLYFHGGGFIGGSLDDAETSAHYIAAATPAFVLSVAYSLAPAHPFPAAPEDAYAALRWLAANVEALRADPERIAVAGDDAGGNLATSVCMIARDRNGPAIAAQVLIGPMLDPSMTKLGDADRLGSDLQPKTCADCYSKYLPSLQQRMHPYASPLESRRLQGLPPALIVSAENDVLHKEAELYAAALIAAGGATQSRRFAVKHAALPNHEPLLVEVAEFLRRSLQPKHR